MLISGLDAAFHSQQFYLNGVRRILPQHSAGHFYSGKVIKLLRAGQQFARQHHNGFSLICKVSVLILFFLARNVVNVQLFLWIDNQIVQLVFFVPT